MREKLKTKTWYSSDEMVDGVSHGGMGNRESAHTHACTHGRMQARTRTHTHTHTHTTVLPGWAVTRRNIHPLTPIMVINRPYLLHPSNTIHGILPVQFTCL